MEELLEKNGIALYSTENEEKSSVCERWNRTIKTKMWKSLTVEVKMTPIEAGKKKNESTVYFNLYGDMEQLSSKPKFKVGDKVTISKFKRKVIDKGHTPNCTDKIRSTSPITYRLEDLNNEEIQGSFYEPEILGAKQDVFRIEKFIQRSYKKRQTLVKWLGYSILN